MREGYLGAREACALVGVGHRRIRILCAKGLVKAEKIGGKWEVEKASLLDWAGSEGRRAARKVAGLGTSE